MAIIKLDISGEHFTIVKSTINAYPESYLVKLISGKFAITELEDRIFIDANPDIFKLVHRYLLYGAKINKTLLTNKFNCDITDTEHMVDFWGYGTEIYSQTSKTITYSGGCSYYDPVTEKVIHYLVPANK